MIRTLTSDENTLSSSCTPSEKTAKNCYLEERREARLKNHSKEDQLLIKLGKLDSLSSPLEKEIGNIIREVLKGGEDGISKLHSFLSEKFNKLSPIELEMLVRNLSRDSKSLEVLLKAIEPKLGEKSEPQLREMAQLLRDAKEFGIIPPMRCSLKALPELVKNRKNCVDDGRPVAIITTPSGASDPQGAFEDQRENIDQLIQNGYRVMFYTVESETQFENAMHDGSRARKASVIIIAGHGSKTSIKFGRSEQEENFLDISDEKWFREHKLGECLEEGGKIILDSCRTAEGLSAEHDNVANMTRRLFPQAHAEGIYSCPVPNHGVRLKFSPQGEIEQVWFFSTPTDGPGQGYPVYRA